MPGLYPPFAQLLFSDHDEVGRVAQRDLCDRVGFDDLQARLEEQEDVLAIGDPDSAETDAHSPAQRLNVQQSLG